MENANNEARLRCLSGAHVHVVKHFANVLGLCLSQPTLQKFLLILHDDVIYVLTLWRTSDEEHYFYYYYYYGEHADGDREPSRGEVLSMTP